MHTLYIVITFWIALFTSGIWIEGKIDSITDKWKMGNFYIAVWSIAITAWTILFWKLHTGW